MGLINQQKEKNINKSVDFKSAKRYYKHEDFKSTIYKEGMNLTNSIEFEVALKRAGLTKKDVAKYLGISEMGLYKKINNITEFKASELSKLYKLFKLETIESQQRIFFAQ